jgi:hypothetical protein
MSTQSVPDGMVEVEPVNRIPSDGTTYEYEYTYSRVYLDDIPDDIESSVSGSEFWWEDGMLWYQYENSSPVAIVEDRVMTPEDEPVNEAEQQAYYALSILSGDGYAGRFKKQ